MNYSKSSRRTTILAIVSVTLSPSLYAWDEAGAKDPAGNAERASAAEKQKASIAAMADSIARQRASIQRQIAGTPSDGFFILPRPQHLSETVPPPACPPLPDSEVNALVDQAADKEGLDPELIRGVMRQESAFRPCAVSPKGALGLMQLMPATASQLSVTNPFDPASNVNAGAKFLKQMLDRYNGDPALALAAYNAGPANVDAANGVPKIPETLNYVNQILGALSNVISTPDNGQSPIWPSPLSPNESFDWLSHSRK